MSPSPDMIADQTPPGFLESCLDTRSSNGRDDVLLTPLHFLDENGDLYRVPVNAATDGGSTPRLAWLVPGFEPTGRNWFDWILHDGAYRGTLEIWSVSLGKFIPANLTRKQSEKLLDRAFLIRGEGRVKRAAVYYSLRAAGWRHFRK